MAVQRADQTVDPLAVQMVDLMADQRVVQMVLRKADLLADQRVVQMVDLLAVQKVL